MEPIMKQLYRAASREECAPSVETDTVWQRLGELEKRAPKEHEWVADMQDCVLSAVKQAEIDGFTVGFRTAVRLLGETFCR